MSKSRSHTSLLLVVLLASPLSSLPQEATVWPGETWPRSTPEEQGIDGAAIDGLVADIEAGQYGLVDHFTLIRNGYLVADHHFEHDYEALSAKHEPEDEQYDYDHPSWHPFYQGTDLHTLQSVTKSITSICIGIAMDEGHVPEGVATPAMSFFEAYEPDLTDDRRRAMTLEDLLTMRSGIDWNEMTSYASAENSCIQLEASPDWIRFILDHPMREAPGTRFDYNSGASVLLGKIVHVATRQRIDAYAREKLFEPLGISSSYWKITPKGEVDTEGGLYLAPLDLARIAYLFLRGGEWNGRRIVSEDWVEASVAPHVANTFPGRPGGYGYQWWIPEHRNGAAVRYQGSGYGGQFPIVIPSLDVVVVFNAWNIHERPAMSTQAAVTDVLIPAIAPTAASSPSQEGAGR